MFSVVGAEAAEMAVRLGPEVRHGMQHSCGLVPRPGRHALLASGLVK